MSREGAEVTSAGRAFQTIAPATEKARRPTAGSLTAGTHRSSEVEDWSLWSLCRDGMSATDVNCRRYSGASPRSAQCHIHSSYRNEEAEVRLVSVGSNHRLSEGCIVSLWRHFGREGSMIWFVTKCYNGRESLSLQNCMMSFIMDVPCAEF